MPDFRQDLKSAILLIFCTRKDNILQKCIYPIAQKHLLYTNKEKENPVEFLRIIIFLIAILSFNVTSVYAQPDTLSVLFSHPAGFYNSPFTLTLTSPDNAANIIYTLDGSNPQTSFNAITAGAQVTIAVDPSGVFSRAKTPAFLVRASLKRPEYTASLPETRTYIFPDHVKLQ